MKKILPHPKDKMTPLERSNAIRYGLDYDRIPCSPGVGEISARLIGSTISEYLHSPKLMVEGEIATFERFGHDGLSIGPNSYGIAEAMGANVSFPTNSIPYIEKPFITDYSMLNYIDPVNPYKDGPVPLFLEACESLKKAANDVVSVGCSIGGPLTIASYLRGTEDLLKDMFKDPENLHKLLRLVTESCKNCIDALSVYDISIAMADPVSSGTVISSKNFIEFVKPYLCEIIETAIEKTGKKPSFHLCGNSYRLWNEIASFDISVFSIDNIMDLDLAKKEIGDKICLMGNVDPVEVMMMGNKDSIFNSVNNCIEKAGDNPKGFILGPGCGLPLNTPLENIDYFMQAARIFGKKS